MKGCLKLTSMPSRGPNSQIPQINSPNEHSNGAQCCHALPAASPASATSEASCVANNASTSPVRTQMHRKCVAFCAQGSETVYTADEWDRTPTEPARKLSYQDLLELKEIQRSLPHANQPPDVVTGRPGKQFLSAVPIVLLPLLSSGASPTGENTSERSGTQASEAKKQCYFSDTHGRTNAHVNGHTNGRGIGWGPPSLTRQVQATPQATPFRPSFPFPPRPVPFSAPASTPALSTSPTSASSITQPWNMNFQSQTKTRSSPTSPPLPSSPTSPFPSSYSNRPSTTSPSAPYPYSNFHPQPPRTPNQVQSRAWTAPPSLSHLMPAAPIKPREKPKFEFLTLLDTGAGTDGSSGPAPPVASGVGNVDVTATKVGSEALLNPASKLPSGLIEIEREMDPHRHELDLEDHDLVSVTSSSSCPSLCTSSCPSSCSTSEVDTDHEHESEIESERRRYSGLGRYGYAKGWTDGNDPGVGKRVWPTYTNNNRSLPPSFLTPLNLGALHDEVEQDKTKVVLNKKLKKKFILVNDMEIELDDSGSESESETKEGSVALSGRITNTTSATTETTTTMTLQTTTTTSSSKGGSPRNIMAPIPVKSTPWGSPSLSASLITPPTTPPSVSRSGNSTNTSNSKPRHSPTSPSSISRGRMKAIQKMEGKGSSTSQDRSGSMGSDTSGGGSGGGTSPSCAVTRLGSPVKWKNKMS